MGKLKALYSVHIFQAVQASNEPDPKRNRALAKVLEAVLAQQLGKEWFDSTVKRAMSKDADAGKEILIEVKGPAGMYGVIECVGKSAAAVFADESVRPTISATLKKNLFVQMPGSAKGVFERRGIVCVEG